MPDIHIHLKGNHGHVSIFGVSIIHFGVHTHHVVTVKKEDYMRITEGKVDEKKFVKDVLEFLLKHEPAEAILQHFNIMDIKRHFPDFERTLMVQYART